ncbi:MAG: sulfurtransferase [Gammaproteobacteria bacterium]|nr:sulfurtransferase [Gammaproteobacteria bacterium]
MLAIIDANELRARLDDRSLRIIDCRFSLTDPDQGNAEYLSGHIPGAVYAHLDRDLAGVVSATTGRHPLPHPDDFTAVLRNWRIGPESEIVVYDSSGGAIAARLWWMLRHWVRHTATQVLDGGIAAWTAVDGALDAGTAAVSPSPTGLLSATNADDSGWCTTAQLQQQQALQRGMLIDARDPQRFHGEREPIDPVAGHIPGAVNLPFSGNLTAAGTFRPREELRRRFVDLLAGAAPSSIVHMCGSGVTACHNLLAMDIAGLPDSRLYVGSWSEWIRDPERPIETASG